MNVIDLISDEKEEKKMEKHQITRREFIKLLGLSATSIGLASCVSQPAPTGVSAPTAAATAATAAEPEGKVVAWAWDPLNAAFESVIPGFQKKYPKITVEVVNVPWDDIHTKLTAAIEAGSGGPDACSVEGYIMPTFTGPGVVDLTEQLTPYRADIAPAKFFEIEKDGKLYGVPSDPPPGAFIYRADLFEAAGISEVPGKWEELLQVVGPKITVPDKQYLFGMDGENSPTFYWWRPLAAQLGSGYFDNSGKIAIDSPEAKRVTKWMYDVQNTFAASLKGVSYWESPAWWSALKENRVAAAIAAPWMISMLEGEVPEQAGKWKAIPMPVWDEGNPNSGLLGGASVVIPAISKNQEAAWKFLEYACLSQEGCVAQYKAGGIWPSYLPAFQDPVFDAADPYFGGQKVSRLFGDLTKQVSGVYYTRNFAEIDQNIVRPHLFKIFNQQESLDEGLKAAATEMQAMQS